MAPYLILILAVCAADQLTKLWALDYIFTHATALAANTPALASGLPHVGDSVPVIDGVLHMTYIENPGMSFGLLTEHRWIFMTVSAVAILAILVYLFTLKGKPKLLCTALALVVGGGIGNMFDRVLLGYVVDFIDVRLFGSLWTWVFNVADAAVCVGAGLLVLYCLVSYRKEKKETAR